jgi:hypothetical protein
LTGLCFAVSNAVHPWEFMICQKQAAVTSSISNLFSVTVGELCGTSWCGILLSKLIFMYDTMWNKDLLKNGDVNFVMKEFPADNSQFCE